MLGNAQKLKDDSQRILFTASNDNYYKIMKRKLFDRRRNKGNEVSNTRTLSKFKISDLSKVPLHRSLSDVYSVPCQSYRNLYSLPLRGGRTVTHLLNKRISFSLRN